MLSGEVARRYGHAGLAEDSIWLSFKGTAGQSFGAVRDSGVHLELRARPTTTLARASPVAS